jgi:hypothetical protein
MAFKKETNMNYGKLVMMCAGIAGVIGVSTLAQAQAQGLA